LLEYLNKPTAPSMEAVRLPIAAYAAAPRIALSGIPTCRPDEQLSQGESGTFVSPVHVVPQIAEESLEDERPTGQWAISPINNPLDLVRDRGVLVRLDGDASG